MDAELTEAARRAVYALRAADECFMLIQSETSELTQAMSEWLAREARDLDKAITAHTV